MKIKYQDQLGQNPSFDSLPNSHTEKPRALGNEGLGFIPSAAENPGNGARAK